MNAKCPHGCGNAFTLKIDGGIVCNNCGSAFSHEYLLGFWNGWESKELERAAGKLAESAPVRLTTECTLTGAPQALDSSRYETALSVLKEFSDAKYSRDSTVAGFEHWCNVQLTGRTGQ